MADPETIYHWRRLDDRITTSGQPTEPQLEEIHALGIRHRGPPDLVTEVSNRCAEGALASLRLRR